MKIRLLSVGKDKGPTAELAQEYADRIRRYADLDVIELRAAGPMAEARLAVRHLVLIQLGSGYPTLSNDAAWTTKK